MAALDDWGLYLLHKRQRAWEKAGRFIPPSYTREGDRARLARWAEDLAAHILRMRGWPVNPTTYKARYDLAVGDARVEVKAARPHKHARGVRYQVDVRNRCDLLLIACVNGDVHWLVVPGSALHGPRHIEIWSADLRRYSGQWLQWLECWPVADEVIRARGGTFQLSLGLEEAYYAVP